MWKVEPRAVHNRVARLTPGGPSIVEMIKRRWSRAEDDLVTLFGIGAVGRLSDAELLARFIRREDSNTSEAAFSALVSRHGAMVLGVCRRMLRDHHAAADAFQAVFLVLARKAPLVQVDDSLGRWLHGVSVRVARRARALAGAERARTQPLEGFDPPDDSASTDLPRRDDLRSVIDQEIARLPDRYRSAVVLCYLEGLTQEQAARRLRCPVGTIQSRLHRARERLRPALSRRGLAPAAWGSATLAATTARAEVPPGLVAAAVAAARLAGGTLAGTVPAAVALLTRSTMRSLLMIQGLRISLMLGALGLTATGALTWAGGEDGSAKTPPARVQAPNPAAVATPPGPPLAEQFRRIRAEFQAQQDALSRAVEKAKDWREQSEIYTKMTPDDVTFCRRMVDLALKSPADPAARDALIWVLNKPYRADYKEYGDEFARAAALLVRHHGDDPEAVRIGLGMTNSLSLRRDELLLGFLASARGRESRGLARMALAQYLEVKAGLAPGKGPLGERRKIKFIGMMGDDGKTFDKEVEMDDEQYAHELSIRQCDPNAIRAEAERLYEEVIADYADVPYVTLQIRDLEALLKQPSPTWGGKPLTDEDRRRVEGMLARRLTLDQAAEAGLDRMHNLVEGKPAPEIAGVDLDGKPRKLSDYRGKVVALVFWGTWCGPCMREVPRERELVERLKGKPFAMLGVNCDGDKQAALKVMKDERITWPNWNDGEPGEGPIVKRYHVRSYPTVFVIDARGNIRQKQAIGSFLDQTVDELLKEMEAGKTEKSGPR
jgi:RNA polymerase sigma factor (sigma-70 family)